MRHAAGVTARRPTPAHRRALRAGALAAATALVLSGCSGDDEPSGTAAAASSGGASAAASASSSPVSAEPSRSPEGGTAQGGGTPTPDPSGPPSAGGDDAGGTTGGGAALQGETASPTASNRVATGPLPGPVTPPSDPRGTTTGAFVVLPGAARALPPPEPDPRDPDETAVPGPQGSAALTRADDSSVLRAFVVGLPAGRDVVVAVHSRPCGAGEGGPRARTGADGEVVLRLRPDADGGATGEATTPGALGPEGSSAVLSTPGADGVRLACADLA